MGKIIATVAAISAIGGGVGAVAEMNQSSVARGRIKTVDACLAVAPHGATIGKKLLRCLEDGVPGGNKSGPGLHEHDPIAKVEAFRRHEQQEANFDLGKVAVGAVAAPFVVVIAGTVVGAAAAMGAAGDYS